MPVRFVLKGRTVNISHFRGLPSHVHDVYALLELFPGTWRVRNAFLIQIYPWLNLLGCPVAVKRDFLFVLVILVI